VKSALNIGVCLECIRECAGDTFDPDWHVEFVKNRYRQDGVVGCPPELADQFDQQIADRVERELNGDCLRHFNALKDFAASQGVFSLGTTETSEVPKWCPVPEEHFGACKRA